jgi:hypothetical protein
VTRAGFLSGLAISNGVFNPGFAATTTCYTDSLPDSVGSLTVTPTATDSSLTVNVNGATVASGATSDPISLSTGANAIDVVVTDQDGVAQTYAVTVTRAGANDAYLGGLAISGGALAPDFASGTTSYTASVSNSVDSLTVTPTANESHAGITVNGTAVTSGSASQAIPLSVGSNAVSIQVYAQDGVTCQSYIITVTRGTSAAARAIHPGYA